MMMSVKMMRTVVMMVERRVIRNLCLSFRFSIVAL